MSSISTVNTAATTHFSATVPTVHVATAADQLARIDSNYPSLDADIAQAQQDVASTEGSDTWAGLKWFEKAVFFILPFGPLLGVVMLSQNKEMHQKAVRTLESLEQVAQLRADLQAEVAASRPDRLV